MTFCFVGKFLSCMSNKLNKKEMIIYAYKSMHKQAGKNGPTVAPFWKGCNSMLRNMFLNSLLVLFYFEHLGKSP